MGKFITRLLLVFILYLLIYVGLRMGGLLEAKQVPSTEKPGTMVTQIHAPESGYPIVRTLYAPICELEGVGHAMMGVGKKKQDSTAPVD